METDEERHERQRKEHRDKYQALIERFGGVDNFRLRMLLPERPEELAKAFQEDENFNNIPLKHWDAGHPGVVRLVRETGGGAWSLSDSVCVLKELARMVVEQMKPEVKSWI